MQEGSLHCTTENCNNECLSKNEKCVKYLSTFSKLIQGYSSCLLKDIIYMIMIVLIITNEIRIVR